MLRLQEDEGAGVFVRDVVFFESVGEFGGFGAGVEDDATGLQSDDLVDEDGGSSGVEVKAQGVDGF